MDKRINNLDRNLTILFHKVNLHKFSNIFSKYIIYFNILINCYLLYYINFMIIIYRYFIELIIINFCFKWLLDRPRPRNSLFKNNKFVSIFEITISKKWKSNQSFPSGHVATVYCTYYIINEYFNHLMLSYFYLLLLFTTIFCRINIGAHHFTDCIFAILICRIFFIFNDYFIY